MKNYLCSAAIVGLLGLTIVPAANAAELKVLTAGAYDQVFQALLPEFEKQTGHTVKSEKGPAGTLKKRVESGEAFDVAIITPAVMEALIKDGKMAAQGYAKVGMVGVGVGVKEGAPKPDISTVEGFKRALVAAKAVAYTDPATGATSGTFVDGLLVRLGIADQVRPKAKLKKGGHAGEFVASGEADIVVQQASEIIPVKGVVLVGPLPAEIQNTTTYAAAVSSQSQQKAAAQALINALTSPTAAAVLKAKGMEPAK
ncbi:MAG TPA: molybdate ABC transporter substrate-binding protein [Pseudolabrys sp.]|nr:molybdate ABC transporter substrate-binding protein [Pseudolabrys sp.]